MRYLLNVSFKNEGWKTENIVAKFKTRKELDEFLLLMDDTVDKILITDMANNITTITSWEEISGGFDQAREL